MTRDDVQSPETVESSDWLDARNSIAFNALRNALYHTSRRLTFERWSRWCNLAVLLLGAGAFADLSRRLEIDSFALISGFLTALIGGLQLVFDFAGKGRDHQALQRDYYHLLADNEAVPVANAADCAGWQSRLTRIAADEPPMLRALDAKAYNDALAGTRLYPEDQRVVIPWWHRILGQVWAYEGYDYRTRRELMEQGA
ncbi:hypothetical protein BJF92_12045 [Rhizobium rhizosphaerae]|uniref:SMODS and SLOG-associating 2TM effector domain-containing protein n=1 Tax=Xaviernesmea rhizosphaerae TaxID=1672749 RepID=A0A1Q9AMZ9_9HYPH|nr:hypothetical protein [Xaviernesmea rhizosphaerae]OLP56797.1 hypothetical protein BJF92_12045 [Xaviernesmea rhizosphaerae]